MLVCHKQRRTRALSFQTTTGDKKGAYSSGTGPKLASTSGPLPSPEETVCEVATSVDADGAVRDC